MISKLSYKCFVQRQLLLRCLLGNRHFMVSPSSCLERGVTYTLRIDFTRYRSDRATPEASILIDSVSETTGAAPCDKNDASEKVTTQYGR